MHKLLADQLNEHLGSLDAVPEPLAALLAAVEASYEEWDRERELLMGSRDTVPEPGVAVSEEAALRQSEEKYRAFFERSREAMFISNSQGDLLDVNPAAVRLFGYASAEEMLQVNLARDIYQRPEDRDRVMEALLERGYIVDMETQLRTRGGQQLTVLITASAVWGEKGEPVMLRGIVRDVTRQRQLERQFYRAQKMEAVGRLAGGVAHEFNNLLTAIIGYSDLVAQSTSPGGPIYDHSQEIMSAARRGGELTRRLLALSRSQIERPQVLSLNRLISEMDALLRRLVGDGIDLVTDLDPGLGSVRADRGQLEQVVLNLTINARDAMPGGGTLTLKTHDLDVGESDQGTVGVPRGRYVVLVVEDTGIGIDEEIRDLVFEPFFTTKERETGSGLGLATVYATVQRGGGYIETRSAADGGAAFEIYLPRVEGVPVDAETSKSGAFMTTNETILLVEDETAVRTALTQFLRRQGYHVLIAANGEEALSVAEEYDGEIDLLLSDVVMPRMNGIELAHRLTAERKTLRVLLISGYTDKEYFSDELLSHPLAFLQKPFSTKTLERRLRQILGSSAQEKSAPARYR